MHAGEGPTTRCTVGDAVVEIVVARLDVPHPAVNAAAALLSAAERKRAARFARMSDRRRFVLARARLRQLLAVRLQMHAEDIELVQGPWGKPALAPALSRSGLHFNLAHVDDVAVYAFADDREVGIDIESGWRFSDAADVAEHIFSGRERMDYRSLSPMDRPIGFLNCWTRKEAFTKAVGKGLHHAFDAFDVSLVPGEPARILRVGSTPGEACGWAMRSFDCCGDLTGDLTGDLIGAVVVQSRPDGPWRTAPGDESCPP